MNPFFAVALLAAASLAHARVKVDSGASGAGSLGGLVPGGSLGGSGASVGFNPSGPGAGGSFGSPSFSAFPAGAGGSPVSGAARPGFGSSPSSPGVHVSGSFGVPSVSVVGGLGGFSGQLPGLHGASSGSLPSLTGSASGVPGAGANAGSQGGLGVGVGYPGSSSAYFPGAGQQSFYGHNFMLLALGLLPALAHTAMATGMAHQFTDTIESILLWIILPIRQWIWRLQLWRAWFWSWQLRSRWFRIQQLRKPVFPNLQSSGAALQIKRRFIIRQDQQR
uniref:Cement-like antigen n=1 Tax=Haemaphysalis longicornis TaxID=44386 RepID=O61297_HAELO|nr:unnamed protein product [Haemaphysalis longicornis]